MTTRRAPGAWSGSTSRWPPWASAISRAMARPSPVPPVAALRALSNLVKRSKTRSRSASGCPGRRRPRRGGPPRRAGRPRRPRSGCVPGGVVGQVARPAARAGRRRRSPGRHRRPEVSTADPAGGPPEVVRDPVDDAVEVDRHHRSARCAGSGRVDSGELEEVVDNVRLCRRLFQHAAVRRHRVVRARGGRGPPPARCAFEQVGRELVGCVGAMPAAALATWARWTQRADDPPPRRRARRTATGAVTRRAGPARRCSRRCRRGAATWTTP